jgi:hypothetical protein
MRVENGQNTRFWEDTWLGDRLLCKQYPSLYRIVNRTNVSVAHVMNGTPLNIGFGRSLSDKRWDRWVYLVHRLMEVHLSENEDTFHWGLTKSGKFTVKSIYLDLLDGNTGYVKKFV